MPRGTAREGTVRMLWLAPPVTVFDELAVTTPVFLTNKSFGGREYTYKPVSLGVAVRF